MTTPNITPKLKTFEKLIADKQQLIQWTQKLLEMLQEGQATLQTLETLPDSKVLTYLQSLVFADENQLQEIRESNYENKITEVTAFKANDSDLLELDNEKPIEKAELRPIPKKDYSPTSEHYVKAFMRLNKRYINILRANYSTQNPTDAQLQIVLDHKDIEDQPNPIYIFDPDGISVHYQCSDGLIKITPSKK